MSVPPVDSFQIIATCYIILSEHHISLSGASGFLTTKLAFDLFLLAMLLKDAWRRKCRVVADTVFAELQHGYEQS